MKKVKVRIYKDPKGKGDFINPTKKFLQKAAAGMQVGQDMMSLEDRIIDELKSDTSAEDIADILEAEYGVQYYEALNLVDDVINYVYDDYANDIKNAELSDSELIPDEEEEPETVKKPPLYSIDEPWISEEGDDEDWDEFGEEDEDEDEPEEEEEDLSSNKSKQPKSAQQQPQSSFDQLINRQPNTEGGVDINKLFPNKLEQWMQYATPVNKKGGNVNKSKFVKNIVRGLHKAAEGVEQQANESSILDTPIKGREAHINNFRRGIKNLGNEFYAKQIYDQTKNLQNQVRSLPAMAQEGMQVGNSDDENITHHLENYANTVGNIFKQPMNQIHGAGYENIPEARKGREQRQAERQQRNMGRDFRRMFGDMAVGYAGVPGMPNYIQMITPQIQTGPGAPQGSSTQNTQANTGPFVDIEYKKGPWWTGRREWSAKGIPAEMMMGVIGGRGGRPGVYYGPGRTTSSSSWSRSWSSPGEIIREKVKTVNSNADPAKNNTTNLNNNSAVEDQRKKYQEYIDNYNNEATIDPVGAGMSRQAPISFEEFIAKDADGLSEYDYWLKRSPGTTTSSRQLNPNSNTSSAQTIPGLIDYGQDWTGNLVKAHKMYDDIEAERNLILETDSDPTQFGYMIDHTTGEVVKNPKGTDVDQRGLVWSGKYDDKNTEADEALVWSNPISAEEYNKDPGKYGYRESYIVTNPDGTQSSVFGGNDSYTGSNHVASEFSPWQDKYNKVADKSNNAFKQRVSYLLNMPKDIRAKNYKELNKINGYDILDANGNFTKAYDFVTKTSEDYPVMDYDFIQKQFGGPISGVGPDQYGNLQKFIYGGDEDIPISPIVAYDNNDIQSKNIDDPFMFRDGGLYKFAGPGDSETNPYNLTNPIANGQTTNTVDQYQTPAFNRYNPKATSASNYSAFLNMKNAGLIQGNYDPTKTYDLEKTQQQQQQQNQNQTQNQNQGRYYPTAPSPMRQIFDMFNPIKKDFTWLSQRDYPRTADGQIYNPQGQGQGQGTTTQNQTQGQGGKPQAGYMYDYKYEKGPWWSGKKTLTVSGKWVDPNNPNAGAAKPGSGNTQNNVSTNNTTPSNWHAPMVLPGTENQTTNATTTQDVSATSSTTPEQPRVPINEKMGVDRETWENMSWQDQTDMINAVEDQSKAPTRPITVGAESMQRKPEAKGYNPMFMGSGTLNQGAAPASNVAPSQRPNISFPQNQSGPPVNEQGIIRRQYGGYMPEYMAYGGYMPSYQGGGAFAGSGPFDPNDSGIAGGGIGPCTEQQVLNAAPGDPCYNEGYSKGLPKDFSVQYDINDAKTLDLKATSRLKNLAGFGLRANANRKERNYSEDYLADNTTSDNREAGNQLDYTGGYSGLNQRIMSKSGAGATGFNRVVGEAAFVKKGGELKYQRGGVYDLTQEEIGQILAAGGQIKFL